MLTLCLDQVSNDQILTENTPPRVFSPIECLPVELLVDIFIASRPPPKFSTDKSPFDATLAECQHPPPNWASLMAVCHRFCDVIVATPFMWSRVPVTKNLTALRQRLKRSGDHLVDLLLKDSCDGTVSIILPHASRIRTIATAPSFSPHNIQSFVPLFNVALPALEEVYIAPRMDIYRPDRNWVIGTHLVFNDTLYPRLKRLSSNHDILPPPDSKFWSLHIVHLDIRVQEVTLERRNDILATLGATPHLESLAITYPHTLPEGDEVFMFAFGHPTTAIQGHPRPASSHDTPTQMRRLQMLKISGPISICTAVLHSFDMPSLEKLYINTSPGISDQDASIVHMFPLRLRRLIGQHTRLHIHAAPDGGGFRLGDCLCDTGRVSSDRFYLRVQSFHSAIPLPSPLGVLRRVFADARLESLEVSYYVRSAAAESTERWREVLQTFGGLRRVTLRKNDRRSGRVMINDIKALKGEGLNPDMVLVDENTDW